MLLAPIRSPHWGMYLAPIRFPHKGKYLAPIISQHLNILDQLQCLFRFALFSCKLCHGIRGPCTKDDINQKFCARLINVVVVAFARASLIEVEIYRDMKSSHLFYCIIFKLTCFSAPILTTHTPNNLHSITYYENTLKVQSEHTQSLHYMNKREFFTCLNCILPIKFHLATLDFAPSHAISL